MKRSIVIVSLVILSITASYEHGVAEIDMGAELTGVISVGGFLGSSMRYYNPYGSLPIRSRSMPNWGISFQY